VVLQLQLRVKGALSTEAKTVAEIAQAIGEEPEAVFHALTHLSANAPGVKRAGGMLPGQQSFSLA